MVNERYSIAMAETLHYLKGISQEDINKIPNRFIEFLKINATQNCKCDFDYTKSLKELNLLNETRGLIAMICLNYWCETEEQKSNFMKHLSENEIQYQEKIRQMYNVDNIFKKKEPIQKVESVDTNTLPIHVEQQNIIKRIFNRIINFFNKNFDN